MRSYVGLRVVFFTILSFVVSIGWAGPKEEVADAKWANVFTDDDPEKILALYDKELVLWGTLSPNAAMIKRHYAIISSKPTQRFPAIRSRLVTSLFECTAIQPSTPGITPFHTQETGKRRPFRPAIA